MKINRTEIVCGDKMKGLRFRRLDFGFTGSLGLSFGFSVWGLGFGLRG